MRRVNKEEKGKKSKEKFSIKSYIRDFLLFADKNLLKTVGILAIVAILLIAITIQPIVSTTIPEDCDGTCRDGVTLLAEYGSKLQVLLVTAIAGIVPYIYAPIVGFIGYVVNEVTNLAFTIKGYGYALGIGLGIIPLILNILTICIVTALGIYICRILTVGYKISNIKNMNFTNFRIKLYEVLQKEDKVKALTQKRDEKIEKLQATREKLNYLQILNIALLICIIQFVSVLIQEIII